MKVACVGLVILVLSNAVVSGDEQQPPFKTTTKRPGDSVEVKSNPDEVIFVVKSPTGIGQGVVGHGTSIGACLTAFQARG